MEREFKGVWIPKDIWLNENLSILEKVMFAEIDSLDGDNGCYASNEYFTKFFNVSESSITRGISKLKQLGYIESESIGGRSRILRVVKLTTQGRQIDESGSSNCEFLHYIENKKENNIESAGAGALPKTSSRRNFRKEHEQLTDELASGKVIDEEKREKKKKTNYEKCLDELSSRNFSDDVKQLLVRHLDWSYNSKDTKRIKDRSSYKSKLDFLEQRQKQGDDLIKIIQQSLDRGWHAFYEYKGETVSKNSNEPLADRVVMNNPEEARKVLEQLRANPNKKVY